MFLARISFEEQIQYHFVDAKTYTECEALIVENFPSASIKGMPKANFAFTIRSTSEDDDKFFKCKVEAHGEGSKCIITGLVQCMDIEDGIKKLKHEFEGWNSDDNNIVAMDQTKAISIIKQESDEKACNCD